MDHKTCLLAVSADARCTQVGWRLMTGRIHTTYIHITVAKTVAMMVVMTNQQLHRPGLFPVCSRDRWTGRGRGRSKADPVHVPRDVTPSSGNTIITSIPCDGREFEIPLDNTTAAGMTSIYAYRVHAKHATTHPKNWSFSSDCVAKYNLYSTLRVGSESGVCVVTVYTCDV